MREPRMPEMRRRDGGFTLLEMMIALVLGLGLLAIAVVTTSTASNATEITVTRARLTQETSRAMHRITSELIESGTATLSPAPLEPLGSSSIRFRQATGFQGGAIQWGPEKSIELRPDPDDPPDGIDNDGNGLVDEGIIVLRVNVGQPDEKEGVLANAVAPLVTGEINNGLDDNDNGLVDEQGLSFVLDGDTLVIRICRQARLPDGRVLDLTLQGSVSVRNG